MRWWLGLVLLVPVLACGDALRDETSSAERSPLGDPPNVILISIDTLNADVLSAYGADTEVHPFLEALATRSAIFTRAHSTASWTLPAHASLHTGLYPDRHSATARGQGIAREVSTLAEHLQSVGFETVAFTSGGFVAGPLGFERGFDRYDDVVLTPGHRTDLVLPRGGAPGATDSVEEFDRAITFIRQRDASDPPLFMFLHSFLVHEYYLVDPVRTPDEEKRLQIKMLRKLCMSGRATCSDAHWEYLRQRYRENVRALDGRLGLLMAALAEAGLMESSVVVFASDHGEGFEPGRGRVYHGGRLHADLIRVPLLVSGPGIPPGERDPKVSLVDVAPTILDWLGLEVPADLDGISLVGSLRGEEMAVDRPLFAMEHAFSVREGKRRHTQRLVEKPIAIAVIEDDHWYITRAEAPELYDMSVDPRQHRNLAESGAAVQGLQETALARVRRYLPTDTAVDESSELTERLEALGYVESHGD